MEKINLKSGKVIMCTSAKFILHYEFASLFSKNKQYQLSSYLLNEFYIFYS